MARFGRLKTWVKERLRYSDLNAEFDNILNNLGPAGLDGDSTDLATMRTVQDPAPYSSGVQVESLASDLKGEIERLRFNFKRFFGGTYWYTDPGRILSANPKDLVGLLPFDGYSQAGAFSDCISRGALINASSLSTADVSSSMMNASNKKFGNYAFSLGASNILAFPAGHQEVGALSCHFRNLAANDYVAYNPLLGIELYLNGSGQLVAKLTKKTAASEGAKDVSTITGATSRAGNTSFQHVALRWSLANAQGASSDSLGLLLAGASEGSQISSTNLLMNSGMGGVWFFGAKRSDPTWDKFSSMSVTPDNETSAPWTAAGTAAQGAVSNGVLTVTTVGGATTTYSKTSNVNLAAMTIEAKARLSSVVDMGSLVTLAEVQDNTMSRFLKVSLMHGKLIVSDALSTLYYEYALDTSQFHVYRVTSLNSPSPTVKVYVDGVLVLSFVLSTAFASGSKYIKFGAVPASASSDVSVDFESYAYFGSGASVNSPVVGSSAGQLDDIALMKTVISDAIVTQLGNNQAKQVFDNDLSLGLSLPGALNTSGSVTTSGEIPSVVSYVPSDGKTPLNIIASGTATNTGTTLIVISPTMDSVFTLSSINALDATAAATVQARRILPVGLRKLSVSMQEVGGSGHLLSFNGSVSVNKG